ncbi:alpha-L-fucosidase [Paenibacillus methanolicus]|uniref:alpha-L-fucosidase n=1 Tax=Paenibacillus methanolicus TaxID=582686 RepID=A0A5S5BSN2_9BACL|nr:alpha-L-fucosidase [Paenibacillus methanolicus]TYP70191.1 alpha-L-fucosidase [Paenibacillus methanolicus]
MISVIQRAALVAPTERQAALQDMEFYAFVHFTVNTFTDEEWGHGTESPAIFDPAELDADQWVEACRDAGMKGLILTCKHHDGFCLWPSAYTGHSVKNSPWKNGEGDVVREVAEACRRGGLKFGIYLSPWDRHEPTYGDSPAYNAYFVAQLRELLTGYGDIFCVWFDGACGEGPNGKRQEYDWDAYYATVRELQPGAVISVCGPDIRWCGNEAGHCRESEWSVVPASLRDNEKIQADSQQADDREFAKRYDSQDEDLGSRAIVERENRLIWYPAEVNTSIRPGWFYHASEDDRVKSLEELLQVYYGSVGGNATFLLNIPPDRRGLFHENDVARLRELGETLRTVFRTDLAQGAVVSASESAHGHEAANMLDGNPDTYWAPEEGTERAEIVFELPESTTFNHIVLQEYRYSQRIERFQLEALANGKWVPLYAGTVVGRKRICRFDAIASRAIRLTITDSRWQPTLSAFAVYNGERPC